MTTVIYSGKKVIIAFFSFLFLVSCSSSVTRNWKLVSNEGATEEFSSSRLYLSPENPFSGLELDILKTSQGQVTFINAFGVELQPEGQTAEGPIVTVTVKTEKETQTFQGFLLRGGHRIKISEEASFFIINSLHNNESVDLQIGHCSTTLIPENFVDHYKKLN